MSVLRFSSSLRKGGKITEKAREGPEKREGLKILAPEIGMVLHMW